jgi:uncharacterized protein (TIGR04255 family)
VSYRASKRFASPPGGTRKLTDDLPTKLKEDAIVEALFEIRFEPPTTAIPELFFGKLAESWRGFSSHRLPAADFPAPMKRLDENLRYQPSFELRDVSGNRFVRFGSFVFTYHQLAPYPGWDVFGRELKNAAAALFSAIPNISIKRMGLRYINALEVKHGVFGVDQLKLSIKTGGADLKESLNLNYLVPLANECSAMVRLATPDLIQGNLPERSSFIFDIDVFTSGKFEASSVTAAKDWLDKAHKEEKTIFFSLLREDIIEQLRADS